MKFNINQYVKVRLTQHGHRILEANHENLTAYMVEKFEYIPPNEDEKGWSTWQLWRLMEQFGPHICASGEVPFETEIDIVMDVVSNG